MILQIGSLSLSLYKAKKYSELLVAWLFFLIYKKDMPLNILYKIELKFSKIKHLSQHHHPTFMGTASK